MSEYIKTSDIRKLISAAKYGDICSIDDLTNGNPNLTNVLKYVGVDVLDLVRCEECTYWRNGKGEFMSYCVGPPSLPSRVTMPWDYCSWGCRRKSDKPTKLIWDKVDGVDYECYKTND